MHTELLSRLAEAEALFRGTAAAMRQLSPRSPSHASAALDEMQHEHALATLQRVLGQGGHRALLDEETILHLSRAEHSLRDQARHDPSAAVQQKCRAGANAIDEGRRIALNSQPSTR